MFGRLDSPDYASDAQTLKFLVTTARLERSGKGDVRATLTAGPYRYEYVLSKDAVTRTPLEPWLLAQLKAKRRWVSFEEKRFFELAGISAAPVGLAAGFKQIADATSRMGKSAKYRIAAMAILATTGTGLAGYYLAHSDERDFENPTFMRVMLEPNSWRELVSLASTCGILSDANPTRDPAMPPSRRNQQEDEREQPHRLELKETMSTDQAGDIERQLASCRQFKDWLASGR